MVTWSVSSLSVIGKKVGNYYTPCVDEKEARALFDDLCRQQLNNDSIRSVALWSSIDEQDTRPDNDRPGQHAG
jgi:hypothetical protein